MLIGVVGKANVGKSTFFKAATLAEVEIANYPFATIKPNTGVGFVRVECADRDFGTVCSPKEGYCLKGARFVPVSLIDVAGLVPGAHKGKGMGNQFLDDLRQADCLIHVIDAAGATNEMGEPADPGTYDPASDIRFLEEEIDQWIFSILKKGWERFSRQAMQEKKKAESAIANQLSGLNVSEVKVSEGIKSLGLEPENIAAWKEEEIRQLASWLRKRTKPMIIAANKVDIAAGSENLERLKGEFPESIIIGCSSESELALKEAAKKGLIDYIPGEGGFTVKDGNGLNEMQKKALEFIRKNVLDRFGSTGVQSVLDRAAFELLGLIALFPVPTGKLADQEGKILPDCLLMPKGSTAIELAYKVHSELGNRFIRAVDIRTKMAIGKEHILKNRDVVEIVADR